PVCASLFFFNDTATSEIHTLSLHDALPIWKAATQTVFGEGSTKAVIMLVGEQPGDQEDRIGRPFVGPAGRLLDQALAEAEIDRSDRKSTRLNSSHLGISYAVFCLKKKKKTE